jgi:polysaccharide export outer membrane protein
MSKAISSDRCSRFVARGGVLGGVSAAALSISLGHVAYAGDSAVPTGTFPQLVAQQSGAQPSGESPAVGDVVSPDYLIGPGDSIELKILRNPELSGVYTVRPDGRLSTPLIEDLVIVGHTPSSLARELEERLSVYVQDPVVTVIVRSFSGDFRQQIRVVGAATQPSAVAYRDRMTVLDVLIAVGGLSTAADGNAAILLRRDGDERRQIKLRLDDLVEGGDTSANIAMAPGDVVIIPEGFFSGEWRATPNVSFEETFTDNVDLDPDGEEESALISTVRPGLTFTANAARINWAFAGNVALSHQTRGDDEGLNVEVDLNNTGNVELVSDLFFIDALASVSQEVLTNEGSSSGSEDNNANRETVQNYQLSPYVTNRLGDFARMETRYRLSQVFVDSDDVSNTTEHEGSVSVGSGPDFTSISWNLSLSASEAISSDDDDVSRRDANFTTTYALTRQFFVTGSIGYQIFEDGETENDIDDPTWRVGARWQPSSRTSVEAGYGQRDAEKSFDATLRHQLSPRTIFSASYEETLETAQERLGVNLNKIVFDPQTGRFQNSETGEVITSANDLPFDVSDETTRVSTFRAGLNGSRNRNRFGINARAQFEDNDNNEEDQSEYGLVADWGRTLNDRTNFSLTGSYEYNDLGNVIGRIENEYKLQAGLSYKVFNNISASVNYTFTTLKADDSPEEEFTENAVTVGLRASF